MLIRLPKTLKQEVKNLAAKVELTAHGVNRTAPPHPSLTDLLHAALELLHDDPQATHEALNEHRMPGGPKAVDVERWEPRRTPALAEALGSHDDLTSCLPVRGRNQALIRLALSRLVERYQAGEVIVETDILRRQGARQTMPDGRRITASMISQEAYALECEPSEEDLDLLRCDARRVQYPRRMRVRGCRFTPALAELIGEICSVRSRDGRSRDGQDRMVTVSFESDEENEEMRVNAFDLESTDGQDERNSVRIDDF